MVRLSNSWKMFKACLTVLSADKELLIFPILSAVSLILVTLTFVVPLFLSNLIDGIFAHGLGLLGIVILFLFYVVQYTVIFFSNTALVGAALIRLHGGDPTIQDGFSIAARNFGSILGYALIAATVGVLLRAISQRSRGFGRIIASLIGMSWNLATYLVVPILAVESVSPVEAIKRSASYLRRTWGEQIAGNLGLGILFGFASLVILICFAPIFYLILSAQTVNMWLLGTALVLLFFILTALGLVKSTLESIYSAAVYQYAIEGQASGFFDEDLVRSAFRQH
jgi:hypothetical protein